LVLGKTPELNLQKISPPKLLGQADGPIAKFVFQDVANAVLPFIDGRRI
jgi:hypothetical protein